MIIHLAEVHFAKMIESNQKIFHLSVQQSDSNIFSRLVSNIVFPSLPILKRAAGPPITEVCPCPHYGGMPYYPCPLSDPRGVRLCRLLEVHWAGAGQGVHSQYLARPTWHSAPAAAAGPPKTLQPPQPAMIQEQEVSAQSVSTGLVENFHRAPLKPILVTGVHRPETET